MSKLALNAKPLWRVRQGTSETRVRAYTHAEAKTRAFNYGFKKPDSVVLIEEGEKNPRMAKVTLQALTQKAKALGMSVRKTDGEYRVAFPGDEASAYYTDDAEDAMGTMIAMHDFKAKKNPKPFGKRKTKHIAFKRKAPASKSKFGKRPAKKNPRSDRRASFPQPKHSGSLGLSNAERWAVIAKDHMGRTWYYTGSSFNTDKHAAAMYTTQKHARFVVTLIPRAQMPRGFQNFYIWHGSIVELMG